jgi:hypothetical protein
MSTVAIIAAKSRTHTPTYAFRHAPGKFGLRAGRANDEMSEKAMKTDATPASQIEFSVESANSIARGT